MTKAEIIDAIYDRVGGFSKKEASEVVEAVFDAMKEVLETGQKIKIARFGNFVVRAKKQRVGRNPQTGAPIPITARRVLKFHPSDKLKHALNPHKATGAQAGAAAAPHPAPMGGAPGSGEGGAQNG
ncbi:MAG: integration host factor subunit alpha [Sandaracinus sp.]